MLLALMAIRGHRSEIETRCDHVSEHPNGREQPHQNLTKITESPIGIKGNANDKPCH